jgi:hypothetical protein
VLIAELLINLVEVFKAIESFSKSIEQNDDWSDIIDDVGSAKDFFGRLFNFLTAYYLKVEFPPLYSSLLLIGLIEETNVDITFDSQFFTKTVFQIHWNRISDFFTGGIDTISDLYGWGGDEIDYVLLLSRLRYFGLSIGVYSYFDSPHEHVANSFNELVSDNSLSVIEKDDIEILRIPFLPGDDENIIGLEIYPLVNSEEKVKAIGIAIYLNPGYEFSFEITESITLNLDIQSDLNAGFGIIIQPDENPLFLTAPFLEDLSYFIDSQTINTRLYLTIAPNEEKLLLLGNETGSRFQIGSAVVTFGLDKSQKPRFYFETDLKDGAISISTNGSDGFISQLIPGEGFETNFDLGVGLSSDCGVYFKGSSSLEILLSSHFQIGPIDIAGLKFSIIPSDNEICTNLGANIKAELGPLQVVVDNIGLKIDFSFIDNNSGNLGPVNIDLGFKPPNGIGLSIDAEVVKGAGYLFIDTERGEYAGAMELTFQDFLSLKAIGLINTKMPDGSDGFSMLIIITAEFTIQIGMGFVFLGAGGLLGLHRTAKLEPLAQGVRSGATANILFPTNVVENAPQIISDIKVFFPIQKDHFLIGPMIKLGYGQPPLISISLGVIIEIRTDNGGSLERIAILGVVKCILPEEKAAILILQVNFIGAVDFTTKTGFFFASIFESRILTFTIAGEMGLLVAWGSNSNFLVSVGGFHPGFDPPKLPFPVPKRVSLSLLNTSSCKILAEGYFAITTNTVQFGSKIQISLGFSDFKVEGHLAFDALFQFNPFFFIISISGKVSLKVFGFDCFSISLKFTLKGPTRFNAKGYGKIKILFFSFKARFDKTWGASKNTTLPPIEVMPILLEEINNSQNWEALPPASGKLLVNVRDLSHLTDSDPDLLVLHPVGSITVIQRAIPLERKLDKVGNQKPSDANRFALRDLSSNNFGLNLGAQKTASFAPGQFFKLSKSETLSSPATRKYMGGQEIIASDGSLRTHGTAVRHVRYELITIDTAYQREQEQFYQTLDILYKVFLKNNASAKFANSWRNQKESVPFDELVTVVNGDYMVAYTRDNTPYQGERLHFNNEFEAEEYMQTELATNADLGVDDLQIMPASEVNIDENILV